MQEYKKISITKDEVIPTAERMKKDGIDVAYDGLEIEI